MWIECSWWDYSLKEYDRLKDKFIHWTFASEKEVLQKKHRLNKLQICNAWRIWLRELNKKRNEKAIWVKNKWENEKKEELDINYLEYIDQYWISEENKQIILYFWNKLWLPEINNWVKIDKMKVFKFLLKLFVEIESNWKNIKNNDSWAEWYFQYKASNCSTWYEIMINWKYYEVSKSEYFSLKESKKPMNKWKKISKFNIRHKKSSYELALYRVKEYYKKIGKIPDWVEKAYQKTPMGLTVNQQTTLFLMDLFTKDKKVKNGNGNLVWIKDFLKDVVSWNEWWIKKIYYIFHHTNPHELTIKRVNKIINKNRKYLIALS